MRKSTLLGASMLLLAATVACNRQMEKDLDPTAEGFVKLRFSAVVDDGSTRTAYTDDKTAAWVAGDQISVLVSNGTDQKVATFTADESLTFEGTVPEDYTTIVAAAYPADAAHTFDAAGVKTLNLPASRTLAEGADPASILPLAGTFADGVMTFHHPFGALKFTVDNVPATAVRFRFTTFGHRVSGSYALDDELEDTLVDAEKSMDIVFPAAEGSRSFYVPLPAGELYPESVIALYDAEDKLVFQKIVPVALTVNANVIKRIAAVGSWKKNEEWQAAYLRDTYNKTSEKVVSYVNISGTETGKFDLYLATKSTFESRYGTIEGFLSSNYIANQKENGKKPKSGTGIWSYNKLSPGEKVMVIYGLDDNYNFTGEYNIVEFEVPEFVTPEGWSLEFNPTYTLSNGEVHPAVHVKVPEGTSYSTSNMKKEKFLADYGGDVAAFVWAQRTGTSTIRTSKDINLYFSSLDETDYVYIVYGVNEREEEGADRTFTYEYCLLEYTYTAPSGDPTEAYSAWLGQWSVTESSGEEPFTDTWTVTTKVVNSSYTITGLANRASWEVAALLDGNGTLLIKAQKNLAKTTTSSGYEADVNLYGKKSDGKTYSGTYDLMRATLDGTNPDGATLAPPSTDSEYVSYLFYGTYVDDTGANKGVTWKNGTRSNSAVMTRVVSDSAPEPDIPVFLPDEEPEVFPAE